MARHPGDVSLGHPCGGGRGAEPRTEAVPPKQVGVEPNPLAEPLNDPGHRSVGQPTLAEMPMAVDPSEQGTALDAASLEPLPDGSDGTGLLVRTVAQANNSPSPLLVGFRAPDGDRHTFGAELHC